MSQKIYLFSNGSQSDDWEGSNCDRCTRALTRAQQQNGDWPTCELQSAMYYAAVDDGSVSEEIARRIGRLDNAMSYAWMCPEVEWTEEWKDEVRRRRGEAVPS